MEIIALVCVAAFVSQLVKGVTGFGSALVLSPLLALVWSPAEAILLVALADLLGGALLMPRVWGTIAWRLVAAMLPGLWLGQAVGTWLLVRLPEDTTRIVIGTAILLFGAIIIWRPIPPGRGDLDALPASATRILGVGALSATAGGVMGGLIGAGGPPVIAFSRHYFTPDFYRAQLIALFWPGALSLTLMLLAYGQGNRDHLIRLAAMIPFLILGNRLGEWLSPHVSAASFNRLVGVLLVLVGVGLMR